jgi:hypothetical protein
MCQPISKVIASMKMTALINKVVSGFLLAHRAHSSVNNTCGCAMGSLPWLAVT